MNNIFGFIGNIHHQEFVKKYLLRFLPDIAVETGTLHGWTTRFLVDYVKEVHSIELRVDPHMKARRSLKGFPNIELYCGNSVEYFRELLPTFSVGRILFYLDAHWEEYWPLFDELTLIAQYIGRRAIVLIDDFKTPDRNYSYDIYKNVPNCMETVDPYLKNIFGNYHYEYADGPEKYSLVLDESQLNGEDKDIYNSWFKEQSKNTSGKIIAYAAD